MTPSYAEAAAGLFERLLARTHLSGPSDVADILAEGLMRTLSATDVVFYCINREGEALVPFRCHSSPERAAQQVDGSMAGRAFAISKVLWAAGSSPAERRIFVPILDGTDRLGAYELSLRVDGIEDRRGDLPVDLVAVLERYGHLAAHLFVSKGAYGDALELAQRSRPMELGAELLWSVLPPLTFAAEGLVVSAMLEPAYENGGDAFDYAVNDDVVHLAVFDGVGHGLPAARLSTFAVAAFRHSRRAGRGLIETYQAMDTAFTSQFGEDVFVTGVLAQLDAQSGRLHWVNAGHPPPLVLRDGRIVRTLDASPATPLGMPMFSSGTTIAEEKLEPGDTLVLYTDGVTEAVRSDGALVGVEGFADFIRRGAAAQQSPPETLRRLQHFLRKDCRVRDDATVLLVDWRGGAERSLLPQTV